VFKKGFPHQNRLQSQIRVEMQVIHRPNLQLNLKSDSYVRLAYSIVSVFLLADTLGRSRCRGCGQVSAQWGCRRQGRGYRQGGGRP